MERHGGEIEVLRYVDVVFDFLYDPVSVLCWHGLEGILLTTLYNWR